MKDRIAIQIGLFLTLFLAASQAHSYQFWPTDVEWQSWPSHCKGKYVWTGVGRTSKWVNLVAPQDKAAVASLESEGIHGIHHHCAGTIWLRRAELANSQRERDHMLDTAFQETLFAFQRSNQRSSFFAHIAAQMATIKLKQGEPDSAVDILKSALINLPHSELLYSATAVIQQRTGQLHEARETLLAAHALFEGRSAEIAYNLGLVSLELGQVDAATDYAKAAYDMGFPLPGLRVKLQRVGRLRE